MEIIQPHKKVSREAIEADIPKIRELSKEMIKLCQKRHGRYLGTYALAHCQVETDDPIRFFVTREGNVFINPQILNHTKTTVDSKEGCASYPDMPEKIVQRYNKITVSCYSSNLNSAYNVLKLNGRLAKIFQHEIDHFNGEYIFDKA